MGSKMWRNVLAFMWCTALAIQPFPSIAQKAGDGSAVGQLLAQNPVLAEVARADPDALPSLIDRILRIRTGQASPSRTGSAATAQEKAQIDANPALAGAYQRDPAETLVLLRAMNESVRKARLGAALNAPRRLALVVGVSGDEAWGRLTTTTNDAKFIAGIVSQQLGFELVTGAAVIDPDRNRLRQAIRAFAHSIGPDTVALFYYAGHGQQFEGEDYLVPGGAPLPSGRDEHITQLLSVDDLIQDIKNARGRLNIVVLDACRDLSYDVASRSGNRDVRGLVETGGPPNMSGTVVIYSASRGETAKDYAAKGDRDSPFATAFAAAIVRPGIEMRDAFDEVQSAVQASTNYAQNPSITYSAIGKFYFVTPQIASLPIPAPLPAPMAVPPPAWVNPGPPEPVKPDTDAGRLHAPPPRARMTPQQAKSQITPLYEEGVKNVQALKCGSANKDIKGIGEILESSGINIALNEKHTPIEQDVQNMVAWLLKANAQCEAATSPDRIKVCNAYADRTGFPQGSARENYLMSCDKNLSETTLDFRYMPVPDLNGPLPRIGQTTP